MTMTSDRFRAITSRFGKLRLALAGDFCLDRYLEIDPSRGETSLETALPVHNVVRVRAQPGAAGTILNNLVALGVGELYPVGFCGEDGEGYELARALAAMPGVKLDHFVQTTDRRTFTYCKPLVVEPGQPPRELNRLDSKNWSPTPPDLRQRLATALRSLVDRVDAIIIMDQVDQAGTGVVTPEFLAAVHQASLRRPDLFIIADSRRTLRGFPPLCYKMNAAELAALVDKPCPLTLEEIQHQALALAKAQGRHVFVTLSEQGILGAAPLGMAHHLPPLPLRGPIDIVGAGDAVTANLAAAFAGGATLPEALILANTAASIVIHQLGTTGTAPVPEMARLLGLD
jgi:rfaE bifunctional protein kinase chain/domain